jgi:hypothetical protein
VSPTCTQREDTQHARTRRRISSLCRIAQSMASEEIGSPPAFKWVGQLLSLDGFGRPSALDLCAIA